MKKFLIRFIEGFFIGYALIFAFYLLDNLRIENTLLQLEKQAYEASND